MKKYFITATLLLLLGSGGLFLSKELTKNSIGSNKKEALPVAVETKSEPSSKSPDPLKGLKADALVLLAKNPVINDQIAASEKNQIIGRVADLKKILADNFSNFQAWIDLGNYYRFSEDYPGALAMFNFAAELQPTNFVVFHDLGDLYGFYLKDSAKSEENFLKSIQYNPKNIDAYLELSSLYRSGYQGKTNSETLLLEAIQRYPNDPNFLAVLGQYYEENNKLEEALKYYQRAFDLMPENKNLEETIQNLKIQLGLN